MANDEDSNVYNLDAYRSQPVAPATDPLNIGGGGGTFGGMEARVAKLEADVEHIKNDVAELKGFVNEIRGVLTALQVNFATLTERVGNLPTKAYIGTVVVGGIAFAIAVLTLFSKIGWLVAGPPAH